jgi:hypothetical protein
MVQPALDELDRATYIERLFDHKRACAEADEREQHDPRKADGLGPREALLQPIACQGMAGEAGVVGKQKD